MSQREYMISFKKVAAFVLFIAGYAYTMNYELVCIEKTDLTQKIADAMRSSLHQVSSLQFADGELHIKLKDSAVFKDKVAIIIQSTGAPVNTNIFNLAFCAQELKNAGARKVIAVIPYFGYSRQERSTIDGKPGHAQTIARLFEGAGIDELVAVELHDEALINLFSIPVHNVNVQHTIAQHIKNRLKLLDALTLIAPDAGAQAYVQEVANELGVGLHVFEKERYAKDKTRVINSYGDVSDVGVMIDDIISTGGTAINACGLLHEQDGFTTMYGYFVHPVLAGPALERIKGSRFAKIFVSNTLALSSEAQAVDSIEQFDVTNAIVGTLQEILYETSTSHAHLPHASNTLSSKQIG